MRSRAFSCFAGFSSCFARLLYSSIVREKEVRLAEREPSAAGLRAPVPGVCEDGSGAIRGVEERFARSLRMEVLCLRAELNVVFWVVVSFWFGPGGVGGVAAYHGGKVRLKCSCEGHEKKKKSGSVKVVC